MKDKLVLIINQSAMSLANTLGYSAEQTLRECTIRELLIHIMSNQEVVEPDDEMVFDDEPQAQTVAEVMQERLF